MFPSNSITVKFQIHFDFFNFFFVIRYPLFVHLENHCSIDQQKIVSRILKDTLASYLYLPKSANSEAKSLILCSPDELTRKIIIVVSSKYSIKCHHLFYSFRDVFFTCRQTQLQSRCILSFTREKIASRKIVR